MTERSFAVVDHRALVPSHLAFPVDDIDAARSFYLGVLGCPPGRRHTDRAFDFQFFGHHLVAHVVDGDTAAVHRRAAGLPNIRVRHFGAVVPREVWDRLWAVIQVGNVTVLYGPEYRHVGDAAEEALVLVADPFGNVLEFKGLDDPSHLFVGS
jgi:uncharacterized protein